MAIANYSRLQVIISKILPDVFNRENKRKSAVISLPQLRSKNCAETGSHKNCDVAFLRTLINLQIASFVLFELNLKKQLVLKLS